MRAFQIDIPWTDIRHATRFELIILGESVVGQIQPEGTKLTGADIGTCNSRIWRRTDPDALVRLWPFSKSIRSIKHPVVSSSAKLTSARQVQTSAPDLMPVCIDVEHLLGACWRVIEMMEIRRRTGTGGIEGGHTNKCAGE